MFRYLPEQASSVASDVDWINNLITDISLFFTVAIVGSMIYFAIKYRKKDGVNHPTPHIHGNMFLELIWTIVPTIICIFVAGYGIQVFNEMREVPADAISINVKGRQWNWDFEYPENGKTTSNELVVPVGKPIKLVMTSNDVLHSFFIPAMRVKHDVIPGRYSYVSFTAIKTGEYDVFCTEYCGLSHSAMLANLKVVSEVDYNKWLFDDSDKINSARTKPADLGRVVYEKQGCKTCHTIDGSRLVGPSFLKLYGREEAMEDGTKIKADENYIKESIIEPQKKTVAGYPVNGMYSFKDILNEEQIHNVIEYIKTLDGNTPVQASSGEFKLKVEVKDPSTMSPLERGKAIYNEKACVGCHSLDGSKVVGPSYKGLFGRNEKFSDGTTGVADEAYLKESILKPNAKVVEGYTPGMMPAFEGQLSDEQLGDVIEFIKSIK